MQSKGLAGKIFNTALNSLAWLVFIFSVFVAIVTVVAFVNDPEGDKGIFGVKFYSVQSDSMSLPDGSDEPVFFNAGDVIIVRDVANTDFLKAGDVISFTSENADSFGKTLTHKIREVKRNPLGEVIGFVTYGIKTGVNDEMLVRPYSVKGLYYDKIPSLGWAVDFLKQPTGYFMCILFPFVLLIIHLSIKVGTLMAGGAHAHPRVSPVKRPDPPKARPGSVMIRLDMIGLKSYSRPKFVLKRRKSR